MTLHCITIPSKVGVETPIEFITKTLWVLPTDGEAKKGMIQDVTFVFNGMESYQQMELLLKGWYQFFGSLLPIPETLGHIASNRDLASDSFKKPLQVKGISSLYPEKQYLNIPYYKISDEGIINVPLGVGDPYRSTNFIDLFKSYIFLSDSSPLKNDFQLLCVAKNLIAFPTYFYDNVYYSTAHYYAILESIVERNTSKEKVSIKCDSCGLEIKRTKGKRQRFKDFMQQLNLSQEDLDTLWELFKAYSEDRNKFIHAGKKETRFESHKKVMEKVSGNFVSIQDQIKAGGASGSADIYFSGIILSLLIKELSQLD